MTLKLRAENLRPLNSSSNFEVKIKMSNIKWHVWEQKQTHTDERHHHVGRPKIIKDKPILSREHTINLSKSQTIQWTSTSKLHSSTKTLNKWSLLHSAFENLTCQLEISHEKTSKLKSNTSETFGGRFGKILCSSKNQIKTLNFLHLFERKIEQWKHRKYLLFKELGCQKLKPIRKTRGHRHWIETFKFQ